MSSVGGKICFINGARARDGTTSNARIIPAYVNNIPVLVVVQTRDIALHEEILIDYGSEYWEWFKNKVHELRAKAGLPPLRRGSSLPAPAAGGLGGVGGLGGAASGALGGVALPEPAAEPQADDNVIVVSDDSDGERMPRGSRRADAWTRRTPDFDFTNDDDDE